MTIVALTTIEPKPGAAWDDVQKQLKKACDLVRKHGGQNVTVLATMIGGPTTGTVGVLSSAPDWAAYGKIQQAVMDDPDMQALMANPDPIASWQTYVSQTIPDI